MAHTHGSTHGQPSSHGHAHGDGHMDWDAMTPLLEREARLLRPFLDQAADWIRTRLPHPARILDLGSGPGVVTTQLARAFPGAEAVAVDSTPALLERVAGHAKEAGVEDRVRTAVAEMPYGLGGLGTADLVWAGRSLHHVGDQRAALAEFAKLVNPGGTVALVEGGLPPRYLPRDIGIGRPGLQSRIDAAQDLWFAEMRAELPGSRPEVEDWAALLADAGLSPTGSRTFLVDLPAPPASEAREHVVAAFERLRDKMTDRLDDADRETLDRLTDPGDERSVHRRPDLFLLVAHTVHTATKR